MLWVYDLEKYFYFISPGTVFKRQNLTSTDGTRTESVNRFKSEFTIVICPLQSAIVYLFRLTLEALNYLCINHGEQRFFF